MFSHLHYDQPVYFRMPVRSLNMGKPIITNLHARKTRGSAMAERLREALVSRNSATTKHPIWKLESRVYREALFAWSYVLIQYRSVTDTHTQTNRRMVRHTTTAFTALSIVSHGICMKYYSHMVSSFPFIFVTPNFACVLRLNHKTDFYMVCFIWRQFRLIAFLEE